MPVVMMPMKKTPSKRGSWVRAARWHCSSVRRRGDRTPPMYRPTEPDARRIRTSNRDRSRPLRLERHALARAQRERRARAVEIDRVVAGNERDAAAEARGLGDLLAGGV